MSINGVVLPSIYYKFTANCFFVLKYFVKMEKFLTIILLDKLLENKKFYIGAKHAENG